MQWCLGMYASGSTWIVHTLRTMGDLLFPGQPHTSIFLEHARDLPPGWSRSSSLIVKTHQVDETAAMLLSRGAEHIWVSIRDPRDCVASLMTYMNEPFNVALTHVADSALACRQVIDAGTGILLRYEDRFFDDPGALDRFAQSYSRSLSAADRGLLFQQTRRGAIEQMIRSFDPSETVEDGFPGHRVHVATQWHTHHANRTGEIGRWRNRLTRTQAADVERCLQSWMDRFGYTASVPGDPLSASA